MPERPAARTDSGPERAVIEVHVAELRRLFNEIDPSPLRGRDLDPRVETFILETSRVLPRKSVLELRVHLDRSPDPAADAALLADAVPQYFRAEAASTRLRLRHLFRDGRVSLAVGLAFLALSLAASESVRTLGDPIGVLRESLLIGGWVAMWRPMEVFLYDWWPIRAEARLYDRLAAMRIRVKLREEDGPVSA
jgi:hypothetical protein